MKDRSEGAVCSFRHAASASRAGSSSLLFRPFDLSGAGWPASGGDSASKCGPWSGDVGPGAKGRNSMWMEHFVVGGAVL